MTSTDTELRTHRERVVREHMESENSHDFDATLATFQHPRYEIISTGQVMDGPEAVMGYFDRSRTAFPDLRNELIALRHADDAVIVELTLKGTHLGSLVGEEPTGKTFENRIAAFFIFDGDGLVCERVYQDMGSLLMQVGINAADLA